MSRFRFFHRRQVLAIILIVIGGSLFIFLCYPKEPPKWITAFHNETRPLWMDSPTLEPLIFRVAVLSHPRDVKRRQIIRDNIFKGVRSREIIIEYRFVVGLHIKGWFFSERSRKEAYRKEKELLRKEHEKHGDVEIWDSIEKYDRLSEKRYFALKWAQSFSNASYDYFMTMDSDTFVRFSALARRLPTLFEGKEINPRKDAIMIGRMRPHFWYWVATVSDQNKTAINEDLRLDGPWYEYPIGIGYILSSYLVKQLLSVQPPLPHHIHYPCDDVMIGSWISSLSVFQNPQEHFRVSKLNPWNIDVSIRPNPILPQQVNTVIINDHGWHDYQGRANIEEINGPISWNSVCIHHIRDAELKTLRDLKEFRGEWD